MVTVSPASAESLGPVSTPEPPAVPKEVAQIVQQAAGPVKPHSPPLGNDMVVLPSHYARYKIEPIYFIGANSMDFLTGNIVKYAVRAPFKHKDGGAEDTMKFIRYGIMRVKFLQGDPNWAGPYRNPELQRLIEEELTYHGKP